MKNNFLFNLLVFFTAGIPAVGCGGEDASIAPNTANDVKSPVSPVDQLKSISDDLSKEVDSVMQPITDVDDVATTIEQLPKKYEITSSDLKGLASGVLSGGEITLPAKIPPEAKDDVTALLTKIKGIGIGDQGHRHRPDGHPGEGQCARYKTPRSSNVRQYSCGERVGFAHREGCEPVR